MDFNNSDWGIFMDWVLVVSCVVVILGFIFDIFKSSKDVKSLSKEHDDVKEHINDKYHELQKTHEVMNSNSDRILNIVTDIDKTIAVEVSNSKNKYANLTEKQKDLKEQIKSIEVMMKELERLQTENIEQKLTIEKLQTENTKLKEQINELYHQKSPILSNQISDVQTSDFTQTME